MQPFKIYKASAGSGKTYSLVLEYITILISNPMEYKHILAVTFTNDATEEMKKRVLSELRTLAYHTEASRYLKDLEKTFGEDSAFHISKRAAEALQFILHDYSNFSITTIDAFFQKILRSFARDIGLAAAYNLELDPEDAMQEVIEKVVTETREENKKSRWLTRAAIEKIEEGKSWNIRAEIRNLFYETFKESYQLVEDTVKQSYIQDEQIEKLGDELKNRTRAFELNLKQQALDCLSMAQQYGLNRESFKMKGRSFFGWVLKMRDGDMEAPGTLFLKSINQVDEWYSKGDDPAVISNIQAAYQNGLNEKVTTLYTLYQQGIQEYRSQQLVLSNLSYLAMFESLLGELSEYKEEHDILFISDTNQFIQSIIGDNEESFIFEKAGNYYHHFLIDEFQDTSQLQWKNFKPLISNSISQGYTSLVVGDVKQSIYRFRNGDWQLLHHQVKKEVSTSKDVYLTHNYRSDENIIRFNNTLYHLAPSIIEMAYKKDMEEGGDYAGGFSDCYYKQEQDIPDFRKKGEGYVNICLFEKQENGTEEGLSTREQKLQRLIEEVAHALERGYKPSQMSILVFTRNEANQVAQAFQQYIETNRLQHSLQIVTQNALNITNAYSVQLISACIKYLIHKKDEVNKKLIDHIYRMYILDDNQNHPGVLHPVTHDFFNKAPVFHSLPLPLLTEEIIRHFNLSALKNEHVFMQYFKDAVMDYLNKMPDDIHEFVQWWADHSYKYTLQLPENEHSLQVITIHKSKGMEYDLVFIPFADWDLDSTGNKGDMLWLEMPESDIPVVPVRYDKKMKESQFSQDYFKNRFNNFLDRLNLLYVATTRAKRELYIYCDKIKKYNPQEPNANIRSVFNHIMANGFETRDDLYITLTPQAEINEIRVGEYTQPQKTETTTPYQPLQVSPTGANLLESMAIKQQAMDDREEDASKWEELKKSGIYFHDIVARCEQLEQAEKEVNKYILKRQMTEKEGEELLQLLRPLYRHPQYEQWKQEFQIFSEYKIWSNTGVIKPDKICKNDENVVVIDFKTGIEHPAHIVQVQEYMQAVHHLWGLPVSGYLYYAKQQAFIPVP